MAAPVHASPSPPPPPFTQYHSPPRSLVRDGHTSPLRPRLVVSRNTCPPLSPSPDANSFVLGTAVINTYTLPGPATGPHIVNRWARTAASRRRRATRVGGFGGKSAQQQAPAAPTTGPCSPDFPKSLMLNLKWERARALAATSVSHSVPLTSSLRKVSSIPNLG